MVNKAIALGLVILATITFVQPAGAQRNRTTAGPTAGRGDAGLLAALPQSEAVALINVRRLLDEALPKIMVDNPGQLAEVNAEIEKFKTKTGVDAHQFEQLALGMKYEYPADGVTRVHTVALARGTFSAAAFVAAGRIAANGKYREEKYQGHQIYIFTLQEQVRMLGLFTFRVVDLAVCAMDSNVLALGDIEGVHRAIDVAGGRGRVNADLIDLATRDPNALIGFGGNLSPQILNSVHISNTEVAKDLASVRQIYGTVGMTDRDLEMFL